MLSRPLARALPTAALLLLVATGCAGTAGTPTPSVSTVPGPPGSTAPGPTASGSATPSVTVPSSEIPSTPSSPETPATPSSPVSASTPSSGESASTPEGPAPTFGRTVEFAGLPDEGLSGLVAVPGREGVWFAITDRWRSTDLLVLYADGSDGAIPVAGMEARNLEALAAGPCVARASEQCLYLADIGDNDRERSSIQITRVPLVDPAAPPPQLPGETWEYTYPDGPHDAEAMVVDGSGRIVVVTKASESDPRHQVLVGEPGGGVLQHRHDLDVPRPERPLQSLLVGTVVTDAAWDGTRMLVLTYDQVLEYTAPGPGADPADFPTWPVRELPHPRLVQTEGITAHQDGCGYTVVSEGRGGPVTLSSSSC